MSKSKTFLIALLVVPALLLPAFALPERSVTRTHLMKDIDKSTITIGVGVEWELTENPVYMGDSFFGYCSYAPWDWLEFGIAGHALGLSLFPSIDIKIDVVDIFTDSSRFSCLLMGGLGGLPEEFFSHGGLTVNFRINQYLQPYIGLGSDSFSEALIFQIGIYIALLKWMGISTNVKIVTGQEGTTFMISIAPLATFRLDKLDSY